MANKQALRELQARLAERLQQARAEPRGLSWLAVSAGGLRLLLPLQQAGEIFELVGIVPVPHTQPWMLGVVNLRGGVCTVVDLAAFLGVRGAAGAPAAAALPASAERGRLLAFNAALGINAALLVDRLLGLRHAADLTPEPWPDDAGARPAFAGGRWRDAEGGLWQELQLAALAVDPAFLAVAR